MRTTGLGALIGAGLMLLAVVLLNARNEAGAQQRTANVEAGGELITLTSTTPDNRQQLIVIDPRTRAMSVYHIDTTTGVVSLKSVRNFQYDLLMSEFNCVSPMPREIRAMLEKR